MVRFMIKVALATLIPKLVNETYEYLKEKQKLKIKAKQETKNKPTTKQFTKPPP